MMKKLVMLAIAATFFLSACDDNDKKDDATQTGNQNTSQKPETGTSDSSGTTASVDFTKFCNVVMGKDCGFDISDEHITSCVKQYRAEAEKYQKDCDAVGRAYYLCVSNATVTPCTDLEHCECLGEDTCKSEIDSYSSCMKAATPANKETTVNFITFCNVVLGKSCGLNVSDSAINECVHQYKTEAEQYKEQCEAVSNAYYLCVMNTDVTPCMDPEDCDCIEENACKDEIDSYSKCMENATPPSVVMDVDFAKFCNVIMGKACGYDISDIDINACIDKYKAEANQYKEKCEESAKAYYSCVADTKVNPCTDDTENCNCLDDDMCKTEMDSYANCIGK